MPGYRSISFAAVSAAAFAFMVISGGTAACSSAAPPATDPVGQGLTWMYGADEVADGVEAIDATSDKGKELLSAVDDAVQGSSALAQWVSQAGTADVSNAFSLTPQPGSTGTIAQRTWIQGPSSSPSSWSAVVSVVPPSSAGDPFVYAEQHVYGPGHVDNATVWMVDGGQLSQVYQYSATVSGQTGPGSLTQSLRLGEDLEPLGGSDCAGLVCNPSQLTTDGGKLVSSPQGGGKITAGCRACVYGLYTVQLIKGAVNLFGSGSGGTEAGCALVGAKTGPYGAGACEVAATAAKAAPPTPNTFNTAAQYCNSISDTTLGLGTVCPGYSTPGDGYNGPGSGS